MEPLTDEQIRVLGCLIEKEATVPDTYPLTRNALRSACNQSSSRHPVVAYDDLTIQRAVDALKVAGLVRFVHPSHGERATKFRHVADEALGLDRPALALLAVLALRGPQTAAELRARSERLHPFGSISELEEALRTLAARVEPLVAPASRGRWVQLLGGPVDAEALAAMTEPPPASAGEPRPDAMGAVGAGGGAGARIAALEAQVDALGERLARLEEELGVER